MKIFKKENKNNKCKVTILGFIKVSYKTNEYKAPVFNEWDLIFNVSKIMDNIKFEIKKDISAQELVFPIVRSKEELLDILIKTNVSLARYGDGEYRNMIASGPGFQRFDEKLKERLKEIIVSKDENIIIGITDIFASLSMFTSKVRASWRVFLSENRSLIYKMLDMNKIYYDSFVTRPYIAYENKNNLSAYFNKMKMIWHNKNIIIVEGRYSRLGIGNDLFSNTKSFERIICPAENAFDRYEEILNICLKQKKSKLFIIALGPTATVLAYDLYKKGFRALDLGHIDVEYEWFLAKTDIKTPIKDKYICSNEIAGATVNNDLKNEKYMKEIIFEVK